MKRFVIREASHADFDDIRRFYQTHPDEHVMFRSEEAVREAINDGVFFIALDTALDHSERIIAASAVYTVIANLNKGGTITLKEAGGSNVNPDYKGFGIHKVFHWSRALHKFILDHRGFEIYFGAIICPNENSEKNIKRAGFIEWTDPPESLVQERCKYAKEGQEIKYFKLPIEALADHARELLAQEARGILERRINGHEQVETILSLDTLSRYRPILDLLSKGRITDVFGK